MDIPNHYSNDFLDRASHLRSNKNWILKSLKDPKTKIVPIWRSLNLVSNNDRPRGVMLSSAQANELIEISKTTVFLGIQDDRSYFSVDISELEEGALSQSSKDQQFVDLRSVGSTMDSSEASILAYAKGIMHWHSQHQYCGKCGNKTQVEEAGHVRRCLNFGCSVLHFPRTDPAVIMLVYHENNILLGRKSEWVPGMYSTLAGFVEPGESLEQAVSREVMEEAGIKITNIRYHSSQPWPFPASLMLGFYAEAVTTKLLRNEEELEDLKWFSRKALLEGAAGLDKRPRSDSIARRLIDEWISQGID
tara:strand:+ start:1545 stop:2459 length:915 start_codon:yes stop_codon:yes gene_type:complete